MNDHWYLIRVVFNSAKFPPDGTLPEERYGPVDIFIDDQGTDGDDVGESWPGYVNASKTINESSSCRWGALPGDRIQVRNETSHIGTPWNHNSTHVFDGMIDWVLWKPVADYTGVDEDPH